MGSRVSTGSAACLRMAYCGPFVGDNWRAIVAKYVRQIEADGSDSDTWLSQGCSEGRDSEEGWCRNAVLNALRLPHCGQHGGGYPNTPSSPTGLGLVPV
ncbi:hypothetical protein MHYP_G00255380 [Metynnis hypsauchen]